MANRIGMDSMLERFELVQYRIAVERLDVARLRLREAAYGPREMDEMRFDRM